MPRVLNKKPKGVVETRDSMGKFKKGWHDGCEFKTGNQAASKYTPDMCEKAIAYFNKEFIHRGTDATGKTYFWADKAPSKVGFAKSIGVLTTTVNDWIQKHDDFALVWRNCEEQMMQNLIDAGLTKAYNVTMAKFILSARHGLVEKTAVDNNVKLEVSLPDEINEEAD